MLLITTNYSYHLFSGGEGVIYNNTKNVNIAPPATVQGNKSTWFMSNKRIII